MPANLDLTQFRAEDGSNTKRRTLGIYTGPASYVTGGDPLTAAELKLGQLHVFLMEQPTNGTLLLLARYDYVNEKVDWFDLAGNEVANGVNLSAYYARFEAIGL